MQTTFILSPSRITFPPNGIYAASTPKSRSVVQIDGDMIRSFWGESGAAKISDVAAGWSRNFAGPYVFFGPFSGGIPEAIAWTQSSRNPSEISGPSTSPSELATEYDRQKAMQAAAQAAQQQINAMIEADKQKRLEADRIAYESAKYDDGGVKNYPVIATPMPVPVTPVPVDATPMPVDAMPVAVIPPSSAAIVSDKLSALAIDGRYDVVQLDKSADIQKFMELAPKQCVIVFHNCSTKGNSGLFTIDRLNGSCKIVGIEYEDGKDHTVEIMSKVGRVVPFSAIAEWDDFPTVAYVLDFGTYSGQYIDSNYNVVTTVNNSSGEVQAATIPPSMIKQQPNYWFNRYQAYKYPNQVKLAPPAPAPAVIVAPVNSVTPLVKSDLEKYWPIGAGAIILLIILLNRKD